MERCKAIILDLDDTLYPEREFVISGFLAAARWLGGCQDISVQECADELIALFDSEVRGRTFDTWLAQGGFRSDLAVGMLRAYREHTPSINLHADVEPFVRDCRNRGMDLGLLTDGYLDVQQRKVAALNIAHCFRSIVFSDYFGRACWKPSPVPFQAALSELGADPDCCVYLGDNPEKDFIGARAAGLKSIRVRRLDGVYRHREPIDAAAAPDAEIGSLCEVDRILNAI